MDYPVTCLMNDDDDGRIREEGMKLSTSACEYRGRDLDLACLADVALVSLSLWPRGPGRQVVKSKAWQMAEGEGVGECLDGCSIAIKELGPIIAWARRVCRSWMGCTGRAHYYSAAPCLHTNQHIKQTQLLVRLHRTHTAISPIAHAQ